MALRSWHLRLRRLPAPVVDAGLAVLLAAAITVAINVSPDQGQPPDARAYGLGLLIAALSLLRRRWPLAVLLASAATLLYYNQFPYPGLFSAVPLSVALATAWAAGRRGWALAVAVWFGGTPLVFLAVSDLPESFATRLVGGAVSDLALLAAVLLLGEAIRGRRALDAEHRLLLAERERSERLLLNVLPAPIAARLKQGEEVIADGFPEVTVLFADLVDFTRRSQETTPDRVVRVLDELFTALDRLAERHGLEKIKTVGDAYMAVGGLPEPRPDHAEAVAEMALAVRDEVPHHLDPGGRPLQVRIGIDTGPVVAGVIGRRKFSYDLWGDTVNTASRMETNGVPGCIQVTDRAYRRLRDRYRFERRGPVEIKGKGELVTWFLVGRAGQPR
ncbi:MAG TPA: adenylate/guanylate cyclase domain-containing protein [Actinomycetota bacterium]|nr:adenylate/guanylate cyclase domain-containing protein [Actinomycetota bacterium]